MPDKLYIFGAGQTAAAVEAMVSDEGLFEVAAFCVDPGYATDSPLNSRPVISIEDCDPALPLFVAIGFNDLNHDRRAVYQRLKDQGRRLVSIVSRHAIVRSGGKIGENCLVMELNNIQAGVDIGDNSFLWSGNHIGHHSVIGSHCYVSSHCVISGGVRVGDHTFLGVNCSIGDNLTLGSGCIVGQGAVVDATLADSTIVRSAAGRTDVRSLAFNRRLLRR